MVKKVKLLFASAEEIDCLINSLMEDEHVQFKQMHYNIEETKDCITVVVKPGVELFFETDDEEEFNNRLQSTLDEMCLGV